MVFVMISAAGTGLLVRLHGKTNVTVYKAILKKHVVPYLRTEINQLTIFIQDNAPCHIARTVKTFLFEEDATVIIFTNPTARAGYDTRSIFKRSLPGLNSEFSFS